VTQAQTCHWHPERATRLSCARCGKLICVECMRQHPVGVRCKECDRASRLPTYQVSTAYLTRGLSAMAGLGIGGGVALYVLDEVVGLGFLRLLLMFGLGYVVGEGIGTAVNRRRGLPYQYMAAGAVALALGISTAGTLVFNGALRLDLFALIGAGVAVVGATARLRP